MGECKFCDIVAGKKEDYKIWEDSNFICILDVNPAKPGHCMLIPKTHISNIFDMDEGLYDEIFRAAKRLEMPLKKAMDAKRVGMAIVGFDVDHAHLHLVPLHGSNEMFDPGMFSRASHEELLDIQDRLKTHLPGH